jgi:hypothetical protein
MCSSGLVATPSVRPTAGCSRRSRPGPSSGGQLARDLDLEVLAEVFPALAHQRVRVTEDDVVRIVDTVLLPALDVRR